MTGVEIILLASLGPAILLMWYIYKQDKIEKEPMKLLIKLIILGIISAFCSMIPEEIMDNVLSITVGEFLGKGVFAVFSAFIGVAVIEEGFKFIFLRIGSWKNPAFNYKFDAVVYAVFVSLGFAGMENLLYVLSFGLSIAPQRAILSIPGHMGFAVFMGIYYGKAKLCAVRGDKAGCTKNMWAAFLWPVLFHGIFDACLMYDSITATLIFLAFVVMFDIICYKKIKYESARDELLDPNSANPFVNYMFTGTVMRNSNMNMYQQPQQPMYQQPQQPMYQQPQQPMYRQPQQQPYQQPQQPMYQQPQQPMYRQPQQPMYRQPQQPYQQPMYQQPMYRQPQQQTYQQPQQQPQQKTQNINNNGSNQEN